MSLECSFSIKYNAETCGSFIHRRPRLHTSLLKKQNKNNALTNFQTKKSSVRSNWINKTEQWFIPLCSVKMLDTICRPSFGGRGRLLAVLAECMPTETVLSFVFCAPMAQKHALWNGNRHKCCHCTAQLHFANAAQHQTRITYTHTFRKPHTQRSHLLTAKVLGGPVPVFN